MLQGPVVSHPEGLRNFPLWTRFSLLQGDRGLPADIFVRVVEGAEQGGDRGAFTDLVEYPGGSLPGLDALGPERPDHAPHRGSAELHE